MPRYGEFVNFVNHSLSTSSTGDNAVALEFGGVDFFDECSVGIVGGHGLGGALVCQE
jgi:hypothetical protein